MRMAAIKNSEVTVVVPCRDEEKTILQIYLKLAGEGYGVLVPIAKKSADDIRSVCEANGIPNFMDSGKGKGCAIAESLAKVGTRYVVFFDADGSHEIGDIGAMLEALAKEDADMAIGSRLMGGSMELYDGTLESFFRSFFTLCINQLVNLRFGSRITDTQNGFRAGKTESLKSLKLASHKFEIETEMVMKALKGRMKVVEVPSREYAREFGRSGISMARDGWRYVWVVLANMI